MTDADMVFPFKAVADRAKEVLKRELRDRSVRNDETLSFKCGFYEILRLTFQAHEYVEEVAIKDDLILEGMRRNGILAYRPDLREGKLVRSDTRLWCKDMPERSHRIPEAWRELHVVERRGCAEGPGL